MTRPADTATLWRQTRVILWSALGTGMLLGFFAGATEDNWEPAVQFVLGSLMYGPGYIILFRWLLPRVRSPSRWRTLVGQTLVSILTMTTVSFLVVNVILLAQYGVWLFAQNAEGAYVARGAWTYFAFPILPTAGLGVALYNQAWMPMRALELRAQRADELAASAQLQALRAQIDPHFLFNSLNSIAHLITTDPVRAEECVQRLSEIFRYLLSSKDRTFVTLSDELEIADSYLDIERARFGDQLEVELQIDEQARRWIVPTLIVQPLVENAVRHGISKKVGGGKVSVRARIDGDQLLIDIDDTGVGMATNGRPAGGSTGVGLRNVRDRLAHLYGDAFVPQISSQPGEGTHVRLRVPREALAADA